MANASLLNGVGTVSSDLEVNKLRKYLFLCVAKNVQNDKQLCNLSLAMLYASSLVPCWYYACLSLNPRFLVFFYSVILNELQKKGRDSDMHHSKLVFHRRLN